MKTTEEKRILIQQKKLELIRHNCELYGKLKANLFKYTEEKDNEIKRELMRFILRIKSKMSENQARIDDYNLFLSTGKVTPRTVEKGTIVNLEV